MARVRTSGAFSDVLLGSESGLRCNNTSLGTYTVTAAQWNGEVKTFMDSPTKDYKRKSLSGMIINTPYYSTVEKRQVSSTGSWSSFYVSGGSCTACTSSSTLTKSWTGTGIPVGFPLPALSVLTSEAFELAKGNAVTDAVTRAYADVQSPDILLGVDIAEFRKTVQMLRQPIAGLGRLVSQIQRDMRRAGKDPRRYSVADFVRDNWLQYRYGFLPLVGSLHGAYAALTRGAKPLRRTARGTSSVSPTTVSSVFTGTTGASVGAGACGWNWTKTITDQDTVTVRAGVLYEAQFTCANGLGLTVESIPSTLYELVPYSFVMDWFANFGSWLAAITPKAGVRYLSSWAVTEHSHVQTGTLTSTTYDNHACYGVSGTPGWTYRRELVTKARVTNVTPGLTTRFHTIDLSKDLWLKRVLDAWALSHGALKRRPNIGRI